MYSVIIPSAKIANVLACVAAIAQHQPGTEIIVVWDGIPECERAFLPGVKWVEGIKPFCFAKNANAGIAQANPENDIILCNDDAMLRTPNGFSRLAEGKSKYAVISPRIDGRCCNPLQKTAAQLITEPNALAFVCVYISRECINKIGLLDERFVGGTWEDNDYCVRVKKAGMLLGINGQITMEHETARCTFEKLQNYRQLLDENKKRFENKWANNGAGCGVNHPTTKTKLSIMVCSIFTRQHFLEKLLANLVPQLKGQPVEFLLFQDGGQQSIGEKRQRLLNQSRGDFVVFIDDDDLVAPDYVAKILAAYDKNPQADCIGYRSKRYCDGKFDADCIYSIRVKNNMGGAVKQPDGRMEYQRYPYHVTPIRRVHAQKIGFRDMDHGEDTKFAMEVYPHLKNEEFIDDYLYFYWYRNVPTRTGEVTHRDLTKAPQA